MSSGMGVMMRFMRELSKAVIDDEKLVMRVTKNDQSVDFSCAEGLWMRLVR